MFHTYARASDLLSKRGHLSALFRSCFDETSKNTEGVAAIKSHEFTDTAKCAPSEGTITRVKVVSWHLMLGFQRIAKATVLTIPNPTTLTIILANVRITMKTVFHTRRAVTDNTCWRKNTNGCKVSYAYCWRRLRQRLRCHRHSQETWAIRWLASAASSAASP